VKTGRKSAGNQADVQQDAQQVARNDARERGDGASVSNGPNADQTLVPKPNPGWFTKGNTARLKHGRFSKAVQQALLPEQAEVLRVLADKEAAILVDLGGREQLSTFELDLVMRYQQLGPVADLNAARMFASRSSVRREAREAFMAVVNLQLKIIEKLGIRRRTKDVLDLPLDAYMASQAQHSEGGDSTNANQPDRDHADGRSEQTTTTPDQTTQTDEA
jgi:hypothetical protein